MLTYSLGTVRPFVVMPGARGAHTWARRSHTPRGHGRGEPVQQRFGERAIRELPLYVSPSCGPHPGREIPILKQPHRCFDECILIGGVEHDPGFSIDDGLRRPARATGHAGNPASRSLEQDDAKTFDLESEPAIDHGQGEDLRGGVDRGCILGVHLQRLNRGMTCPIHGRCAS